MDTAGGSAVQEDAALDEVDIPTRRKLLKRTRKQQRCYSPPAGEEMASIAVNVDGVVSPLIAVKQVVLIHVLQLGLILLVLVRRCCLKIQPIFLLGLLLFLMT